MCKLNRCRCSLLENSATGGSTSVGQGTTGLACPVHDYIRCTDSCTTASNTKFEYCATQNLNTAKEGGSVEDGVTSTVDGKPAVFVKGQCRLVNETSRDSNLGDGTDRTHASSVCKANQDGQGKGVSQAAAC